MLAGAESLGCWVMLGPVLPWCRVWETFQPPHRAAADLGVVGVGCGSDDTGPRLRGGTSVLLSTFPIAKAPFPAFYKQNKP